MRRLVIGVAIAGCAAVYPEYATSLRDPRPGSVQEPAPPSDLLYIQVAGAKIAARTRDGRAWDGDENDAPDPFLRLFVGSQELLRTPVQSNTREPTWPDQEPGNFRVPRGSDATLELWDSNAVTNLAICVQRIGELYDAVDEGELAVQCESGARARLIVTHAQAKLGLGLSYAVGSGVVSVSRVLPESPAGRAGIRAGELIREIMGKDVARMDEGEAQSLINTNAKLGLTLRISSPEQSREVVVREGPIYLVKSWHSEGGG